MKTLGHTFLVSLLCSFLWSLYFEQTDPTWRQRQPPTVLGILRPYIWESVWKKSASFPVISAEVLGEIIKPSWINHCIQEESSLIGWACVVTSLDSDRGKEPYWTKWTKNCKGRRFHKENLGRQKEYTLTTSISKIKILDG